MSRVIFMCGPSGSGKTIHAQRLEAQGMTRLSSMSRCGGVGSPACLYLRKRRADIEADLRVRLLELVAAGVDVVLDFSFWSREMRDEWRRVLEPVGVVPETIFMSTDRATVLQRVRDRQGDHSDDYAIPDGLAAQYFDHFGSHP